MHPLRTDQSRLRTAAISRRYRRADREGNLEDCWSQWTRQQMMLINHYGLNLMDPQARGFLTKNMEAFLFKAGAEEDVDTTKKGTITW